MSDSSTLTLGGRLRAARVAAGFSQTDLSERSKIPKPTLSRYENDHVSPSLSTLARLAVALGVAQSELLQPDVSSPDEVFTATLHERGITFATVQEARSAATVYADQLQAVKAVETA